MMSDGCGCSGDHPVGHGHGRALAETGLHRLVDRDPGPVLPSPARRGSGLGNQCWRSSLAFRDWVSAVLLPCGRGRICGLVIGGCLVGSARFRGGWSGTTKRRSGLGGLGARS
jgi:hypothetical protein